MSRRSATRARNAIAVTRTSPTRSRSRRFSPGSVLADDQLLCAAILHDTVEDTPYTLPELRRDFGAGIAAMVVGHMALDYLDQSQHKVAQMTGGNRLRRHPGRRHETG